MMFQMVIATLLSLFAGVIVVGLAWAINEARGD